jgi:cytosine permease
VIAYVVGAVVAVLTAGQVIPGVAAPQLIPGVAGAALNGLVAAVIAHVAAYYLLESSGVLPGHEVAADAERL